MGQAALNADGKTYNGYRLLSWLSEVLHPGKGLSEAEVREIDAEVRAKRQEARDGA
ncbi:hypothetical protein FBY21_1562 [Pseudomonas sp. SLBN-26]|jgi:hypothetical protein|nr:MULTISPECIES: hypothetical protein [Pseudomonas]MCP1616963.1 hypothetical protein [Pseudomonas otitidis]TQL06208.1 hypothetical protein FBY21_1562 [Pseudomonas sp. SLBN-26]